MEDWKLIPITQAEEDEMELLVSAPSPCPECVGTGARHDHICDSCGGTGQRRDTT